MLLYLLKVTLMEGLYRPWVMVYIERGLKAPVQMADGTLIRFRFKSVENQ